MTGDLTINATEVNPITVYVSSLTGDVPGPAGNFNHRQAYTQTIMTVSGTIRGFSADNFTIDYSGFQNPASGTWSIGSTAHAIDMIYTPGNTAETLFWFK